MIRLVVRFLVLSVACSIAIGITACGPGDDFDLPDRTPAGSARGGDATAGDAPSDEAPPAASATEGSRPNEERGRGEILTYDAGYFTLEETYDDTHGGLRLRVLFDEGETMFIGSIENTNPKAVRQVSASLTLSDGTRLGPTPSKALRPGQTRKFRLEGPRSDFDAWAVYLEHAADSPKTSNPAK